MKRQDLSSRHLGLSSPGEIPLKPSSLREQETGWAETSGVQWGAERHEGGLLILALYGEGCLQSVPHPVI